MVNVPHIILAVTSLPLDTHVCIQPLSEPLNRVPVAMSEARGSATRSRWEPVEDKVDVIEENMMALQKLIDSNRKQVINGPCSRTSPFLRRSSVMG